MKNRYLEGFAKILPILLILVSIAGLLVGGIVLGRWDYSIRGLIIAIPTIIASIVLLYLFKHPSDDDDDGAPITFFDVKVTPYLLFILLYLVSVIVLLAGINRLLYFFVIAALYLTIFVQIFSRKISPNIIILEIVSVIVNVICGTTLVYPLFFRTTDILVHNTISTVTFLSGHTIPVDLDASYAPFPLFHIYNAISSNILGLLAQYTHFIVTCLAYVIVVFFLYKIFKILSDNEQISLLACLCFSVTPIVLLEGIMMVTRTAAFVGFVIILYLVFAVKERESLIEAEMDSIIFRSLIIVLAVYTILVHQVSVAQIVLLIALFMGCELVLDQKRYFSTYMMLFITISFSAYWFFTSQAFLEWLIRPRIGLNYFDFGEKHQVLIDPSLDQMQVAVSFLQNQMDMGIFLFFALIGIGYILYRQKPQYLPVVAMFSLLVLVFYVPNPLFTSQTIARVYRIDRFWILIAPFITFVMAFGIFWLSKVVRRCARSKISYLAIVFLFMIFVLLSLQNPIIGITSEEGRLYFTDGELKGYDYVTKKIPYESELYSDYHTTRFFHLDYFSLTEELGLPYYRSITLKSMKWIPLDNQYIIFRDSKFEDWSVLFQSEKGKGRVNYVSNEENKGEVEYFYDINNVIYRNDQVSIAVGLS